MASSIDISGDAWLLPSPPSTWEPTLTSKEHSPITAPVPRTIEPVSRHFMSYAVRRLSNSAFPEDFENETEQQEGPRAADDMFSLLPEEDPPETEELLDLDPKDRKRHDLYAILGLAGLRYKATPQQIKQAYRRKVLRHHPDKLVGTDRDDSYFKCCSQAYDILSDPVKRRLYDSVDFGLRDPQAPKHVEPDAFFETFGPIFDLEARFAKSDKVPSLGDLNSPESEVVEFYNFWYNFESWRSFEYLDDEEGETREDKRYIEKKNKAERVRRRKEDIARLRLIVERAQANDPRIKKFNEEKRRAKMDQKQRKELEEQERKRQKELLEKVKAMQEEEERKKAIEEKKRLKKLVRKEKKAIRTWIEAKFPKEHVEPTLEKLNDSLDRMDLDTIKELHAALEAIPDDAQDTVYANAEKLLSKHFSNKPAVQNTTERPVSGADNHNDAQPKKEGETRHAKGAKQQPKAPRVWPANELSLLIKAVKKYPGGTVDRWKVIAQSIAQHSGHPLRSEEEIIQKVNELKKGTAALAPQEKTSLQYSKKHNDDRYLKDTPTINYEPASAENSKPTRQEESRPWTPEEQQMLERAMQTYPPSWSGEGDRWDHIAAMVTGRTKRECKQRVKALIAQVRAKNAAQG